MRPDALNLISCLKCRSVGLIESGDVISCGSCGAEYRTLKGVPCFVPDELVDFSEVPESARQGFLQMKQMAYFDDSFISSMYNQYHRYAAAWRLKAGPVPLTLDVGFGVGEHYPFVTEQERNEGSYIGLDLDRFKLEYFTLNHPEITVIQADALNMPLAGGIFDVVQVLATLEHFHRADIIGILDECSRVLKPGGLLIACYPAEGSLLLKSGQVAMHALMRLKTAFDLDKEEIHRHLSTAPQIRRIMAERQDLALLESWWYPFGIRWVHGALFVNETYRKI